MKVRVSFMNDSRTLSSTVMEFEDEEAFDSFKQTLQDATDNQEPFDNGDSISIAIDSSNRIDLDFVCDECECEDCECEE